MTITHKITRAIEDPSPEAFFEALEALLDSLLAVETQYDLDQITLAVRRVRGAYENKPTQH